MRQIAKTDMSCMHGWTVTIYTKRKNRTLIKEGKRFILMKHSKKEATLPFYKIQKMKRCKI